MFRFPSKQNALNYMNEIGVQFGAIIDVGTHAETPELKLAYPNNRHLLFEPASEFFPKIAANYAGLNWELVPVAVSDTDGEGRLRKIAISGGEISHSKLDFNITDDQPPVDSDLGVVDIATVRLDTCLKARNEPKPYLLKVDVDGHEMPILRGADGIWNDIDCIIIEAPADTFIERVQYAMSRSFHLFDIVDQCYYSGVFSQADVILLSDRLWRSNPRLRPWETESFAWEKWVPVANYEGYLPKDEKGA